MALWKDYLQYCLLDSPIAKNLQSNKSGVIFIVKKVWTLIYFSINLDRFEDLKILEFVSATTSSESSSHILKSFRDLFCWHSPDEMGPLFLFRVPSSPLIFPPAPLSTLASLDINILLLCLPFLLGLLSAWHEGLSVPWVISLSLLPWEGGSTSSSLGAERH